MYYKCNENKAYLNAWDVPLKIMPSYGIIGICITTPNPSLLPPILPVFAVNNQPKIVCCSESPHMKNSDRLKLLDIHIQQSHNL
jgi:hypothetical protein